MELLKLAKRIFPNWYRKIVKANTLGDIPHDFKVRNKIFNLGAPCNCVVGETFCGKLKDRCWNCKQFSQFIWYRSGRSNSSQIETLEKFTDAVNSFVLHIAKEHPELIK